MSATRIGILLLGLVMMFIFGTWGWAELVNAAYRAEVHDVVMVLAVYGVAGLAFAVVAGFTFAVLSFRNDDPG